MHLPDGHRLRYQNGERGRPRPEAEHRAEAGERFGHPCGDREVLAGPDADLVEELPRLLRAFALQLA